MKTLFPVQRTHTLALAAAVRNSGVALDFSETGTGKTVCAAEVAKELGLRPAVLCPKSVCESWRRELTEAGVEPLFIVNYEKAIRGLPAHLLVHGRRTKIFEWVLPKDTLLIFDEAHRTKGDNTQQAQLLVAATNAGIPRLLLSATMCRQPVEMRAIGHALGLHGLNETRGLTMSYTRWLYSLGCRKLPFGGWSPCGEEVLRKINDTVYRKLGVASRMTVGDLPEAFRDNHIIYEPVEFGDADRIRGAYEAAGITPAIIDWLMDDGGERPDRSDDPVIVRLLRARQEAEAMKVPTIAERVADLIDEGCSPVVFVNFRDSLAALSALLPEAGLVFGGQSAEERQDVVDRFASDGLRCVIAMQQAGGVGLSLHDRNGRHRRVSVISPSFSVVEFKQTLGRIHRAGMKTPATQIVLIAAGSVEEHVQKVLAKKSGDMSILLDNGRESC